ncbi:MAG TPA: transglutaminase family protein, partial [Pirellulales bacterium]|nr:transglutaminase family protein [Pirellulales bacterium]
FLNWQQDPFGNYQARVVFPEKKRELSVEVVVNAELTVINPFDFFLDEYAEQWPFSYEPSLVDELRPYLACPAPGPKLAEVLAGVSREKRRSVIFLVELNQRVRDLVGYTIRLDPGVQTSEETLSSARGSCRDSAWLLVELLRNLGLAARFVSGYLIQLAPDITPLEGPVGPTSDFCDLHAWTEVYLPGAGWIGLDPTSGLFAGEGHLPLACTPNFQSAAPISGTVERCEVQFEHRMAVVRIHEEPRVTKPYRVEQWQAIDQLGQQIDGVLESSAVRLTMGGEPTFVSIDDMDGPEWNTAANGLEKRHIAGGLVKRLRGRFAPGGLLLYGQGKWYPGEQLPRWALACYWRKDGEPIWNDPDLIADDDDDLGHDQQQARAFVEQLAAVLNVDRECIVPGYEDTWHYLWRERRLPVNVDISQSRLADPLERARIAQVFEHGLEKVVGYALPLTPQAAGSEVAWKSSRWQFRHDRMYLVPGDSPMGLRLPLDSLPWATAGDRNPIIERDPLAPRPPLADADHLRSLYAVHSNGHAYGDTLGATLRVQRFGISDANGGAAGPAAEHEGQSPALATLADPAPQAVPAVEYALGQSARDLIITALCVEPRNGKLHVFMPPVARAEDYLQLVAAIEQTAAALETPVVIEGYEPPQDHRLQNFKLTPDPGVLEV